MNPKHTAKTLKALTRWITAAELAEHVQQSETCCRGWLSSLSAEGICRVRNRPHQRQKDGRKTSGHLPREYTLARQSEWGKL